MTDIDGVSSTALMAEIEQLKEQVAALTARAERAEALADHDVLTPVLNRRGFVSVLSRSMSYCRRHGVDAVLLYLDLDLFKNINDTAGHAAGDAALISVARMLSDNVRESDAVGRLGGDEFGVLMMNADAVAGRDKAARFASALQDAGFVWGADQYPLSVSIGVRGFANQEDPEAWLAQADAAMWLRKSEARAAR